MLDFMTICLMAAFPMLPPQASVSGWHIIDGPPKLTEDEVYRPLRYPSEIWFWDAASRVWRRSPADFIAETPQQMACDEFTYSMALD